MLLQLWKTKYFETRKEIEDRSTIKRWEFEKEKLFSETDYLESVATDLTKVTNVRLTFYLFEGRFRLK